MVAVGLCRLRTPRSRVCRPRKAVPGVGSLLSQRSSDRRLRSGACLLGRVEVVAERRLRRPRPAGCRLERLGGGCLGRWGMAWRR